MASGADAAAIREELEALDGLVHTNGWARLVLMMAERIEDLRAAMEKPRIDPIEHAIAASEVAALRAIGKWPGEAAERARDKLKRMEG